MSLKEKLLYGWMFFAGIWNPFFHVGHHGLGPLQVIDYSVHLVGALGIVSYWVMWATKTWKEGSALRDSARSAGRL